jgi:hypothetical protein
MTDGRYPDPAALRQATNARLRVPVREDSQLQLTDLQRRPLRSRSAISSGSPSARDDRSPRPAR